MKPRNLIILLALLFIMVFAFVKIYRSENTPVPTASESTESYSSGESSTQSSSKARATTTRNETSDDGNVEDGPDYTTPKKMNLATDDDITTYTNSKFDDETATRPARKYTFVYDDFDKVCNMGGKLTVFYGDETEPFGIPMHMRNGSVISGMGEIITYDGKVAASLSNGDCVTQYGYITITDPTTHK